MKFDRDWTVLAVYAEVENIGVIRIVEAHNRLRGEAEKLRAENLALKTMLRRLNYIQQTGTFLMVQSFLKENWETSPYYVK